MSTRRRFLFLSLILIAITPLLMADMGPKPSMDFALDYEISPTPNIEAVRLLVCEQSDCSDAVPLEEMGPQGIRCDTNTECYAMAYGFPGEYFKLVLEFDDGTIRTSNIFTHHKFAARYKVTVTADALEVKKNGGSGNPFDWIIYGVIGFYVCGGLLIVGVIVFVIWMIVDTRRKKKKAAQAEVIETVLDQEKS